MIRNMCVSHIAVLFPLVCSCFQSAGYLQKQKICFISDCKVFTSSQTCVLLLNRRRSRCRAALQRGAHQRLREGCRVENHDTPHQLTGEQNQVRAPHQNLQQGQIQIMKQLKRLLMNHQRLSDPDSCEYVSNIISR